MPRITKILILLNVAVFILQGFIGDKLTEIFALWPVGSYYVADLHATVGFHVWQLFTSAFLHADIVHIGLNMYALWFFGRDVETEMGGKAYLNLYFAAVLSAALTQLFVVSHTTASGVYPTIGASGGIFGVMLAYGLLFPGKKLMLVFPPIVMPAIVFIVLYGLGELIYGVTGTEQGVAHFAHLGGMLGGFLALKYWQRKNYVRGEGV